MWWVALGVVWALGLTLLVRNEMVYRYQMRTLQTVSEMAKRDIALGRDWMWRFEAKNSVSYERMLLQFWRPLDSFYDDRRFLSPPEELVP